MGVAHPKLKSIGYPSPDDVMNNYRLNKKGIPAIVKKFDKKLSHFPDGRIDYSNSKDAVAVNILVGYKDNILILKRGDKVYIAKNKWHTVAGHFDEVISVYEKVLKELEEETGIKKGKVSKIRIKKPYNYTDEDLHKNWIIYPVCIKLKCREKIKLNWEHIAYKWIKPLELDNYDITVPLKYLVEKFQ